MTLFPHSITISPMRVLTEHVCYMGSHFVNGPHLLPDGFSNLLYITEMSTQRVHTDLYGGHQLYLIQANYTQISE
jgi:hypothetical protein